MIRSSLSRRRFLSVSAAALAAGPAFAQPITRWAGQALGAEAEITLRGPKDLASAALRAAQTELHAVEKLFSLYDPQSDLSCLNRLGTIASPRPDFLDLLRIADRVHRGSNGHFDPSVQPLWRALATARGSSDEAIENAAAAVGWAGLRFDAHRVRFGTPGMALTFNGIAQGFATDRVARRLSEHGFTETLVNIGEFRAGAGSWTLGVEDPNWGPVGIRTITASALATSSPGALRFEGTGRSHILDPRGSTQTERWSTVSVEASTAALADGYSTAFALMDRADIARALASDADLRRVLLIAQNGERAELT
jgi:thiamine biosynthesis lipoprotein